MDKRALKATELNIKGYGTNKQNDFEVIFRITSRGTGGSDLSQVVLQSYYRRIMPNL